MASSRPSFVCTSCARALRTSNVSQTSRAFSASAPTQQTPSRDIPRWQQTPPAMKMPFRLRPQPKGPVWRVNEELEPLDAMYDRFVDRVGEAAKGQGLAGTKGRDMLPEEVKWLAVTHKSFDHGRRGFNDRLAFLGKRILDLQTSLALLNAPQARSPSTPASGEVFKHAALEGADNMTDFAKNNVLSVSRLAKVAQSYGVDRVVRWKPKKSDNLKGSGLDTVLAHTVYSIIGALALQRGGEVAARTARERVLQPLGLR
ncbi:hypothetical protein LTR36_004421 [Oleoguttula mirabilis]|uniref:RNase III domain-containing protein n=1 Tax=Oleoguttula mirabilis TaxID=1507867 RepID=A0AAV9JH00_9PEZI|nr:hypothetical protein LTR36_004421 [Oleoguttula mirabilis]